ncbi:MAG: InlB B-repeat-containing protein [Gammaproteobacteria bacterium]|nr:InlB B-repeat-containing protein [Gammaproteobacteria bacterium]
MAWADDEPSDETASIAVTDTKPAPEPDAATGPSAPKAPKTGTSKTKLVGDAGHKKPAQKAVDKKLARKGGGHSTTGIANEVTTSTRISHPASGFVRLSAPHAGSEVQFRIEGQNQRTYARWRDAVPAGTPGAPTVGTIAYIPTTLQTQWKNEDGNTAVQFLSWWGKYSEQFVCMTGSCLPDNFTIAHTIYRAGSFTDRVYYDKAVYTQRCDAANPANCWTEWVVTQNSWNSYGAYYTDYTFKLQGEVYYSGDGIVSSKSYWVYPGATYPKRTVSRKGWKFRGWYTSWTGGKKVKTGTAKVSFGDSYFAYVVARFDKKLTVKFAANGGRVSQKSKKVDYRGKLGTLPTPTRAGHVFIGWYWSTATWRAEKKDLVSWTTNRTYKARWVKAGKNASIATTEQWRIWENMKYHLTLSQIQNIVGGKGQLLYNYGCLNGYCGKIVAWYGKSPYTSSSVRVVFSTSSYSKNQAIYAIRCGYLP